MHIQTLDGQQLAMLWIALSKNLFPKPNHGQILYKAIGDGSCTLYFEKQYYHILLASIDTAHQEGKFEKSNASKDWNNLRNVLKQSEVVEEVDPKELSVYELHN